MGTTTGHAEELQGLTDRLQQLENRADKQQQDLTALLKLVRQMANRQAEMEKEKVQPRRQRGLIWPLIFVLLVYAGRQCRLALLDESRPRDEHIMQI